jgi:hypothetical protein
LRLDDNIGRHVPFPTAVTAGAPAHGAVLAAFLLHHFVDEGAVLLFVMVRFATAPAIHAVLRLFPVHLATTLEMMFLSTARLQVLLVLGNCTIVIEVGVLFGVDAAALRPVRPGALEDVVDATLTRVMVPVLVERMGHFQVPL